MLFRSALVLASAILAAVSASPIDTRQDTAPSLSYKAPVLDAAWVRTLEDSLSKRQLAAANAESLVKYARFAGAASVLTNTTWGCTPNCEAPETQGTVVDLFWGTDDKSLSHGFVAHKSDTKEIIISFRGTKTITDWITDADFALHDWPSDIRDSKVHKGFLEAYTSVSVQVKSAVLGLIERYPDYSVVFTGHSLGGAQAAIALTDLLVSHANYKPKLSLYTYGQPRTGNGAFAGWLSAQGVPIYRTTYHYDIVPHIPPKILGYAHHTQEAYYAPNSNSAVLCGSSGENKSCSDGALFFKLTPADHKLYPGLHN